MCFIKWVCFNLFLRGKNMEKLKQKTQWYNFDDVSKIKRGKVVFLVDINFIVRELENRRL